MNKGKKLAKNTLIISIGKISTQVVSFLLLPLYTAILSTKEYGVVDIVTTYTSLLLPIVTCQLEQSIFRFLLDKRDDEKGKREVISAIFTMMLFIVVGFSVIYLIVSPLIKSTYKYYLLINMIAGVYTAIMLQTARGFGNNSVYAIGSFISAAGNVILNVVFVLIFRLGASGMLIAGSLASYACGTYILVKLRAYKYIRIVRLKKDQIKPYLAYSLPLIPNTISWWILNASDRTVIRMFLGVSFNGIYSVANKFSGLYTTIYNIFNLAWVEMVALYLHEKEGDREFTKLQDSVIRFFSCIFLGITAIMPLIFNMMVNEKYLDAYYQIPPLLMGAFFSAMTGVIGAYYVAEKMTAVIAKMTFIGASLNIFINLILVRKLGLYAASFSTLFSYLIVFVIRYMDVRKRFNVKIDAKLASSIMIMSSYIWFAYYRANLIGCFICLIITVVYSVFLNRELLCSIFKSIIRKNNKSEVKQNYYEKTN